jgi:hypothetical protein
MLQRTNYHPLQLISTIILVRLFLLSNEKIFKILYINLLGISIVTAMLGIFSRKRNKIKQF